MGQDIVFDLGEHLANHTGGELTLALVQPTGIDGLVFLSSREGDNPPALELTLAPVRLATTYHYDAFTHELTQITYNDGTPTVTNEYDRLGRLVKTTDAFGEKTYTYDEDTFQPKTETWTGLINNTLTRHYDDLGRPEGFAISGGYQVTYDYTDSGHFHAVTYDIDNQAPGDDWTATYSYTPNSHMISGYSIGDLTRTVTHEANRNLVDKVTNTWDTDTISQFDYTNDKAGRRTDREDTGDAFASTQANTFAYNARNEVIGATMRNGNSTYNFDQIGNRSSAAVPAAVSSPGGNFDYTTNALNQYTAIENGAAVNPIHDLDGNLINDGKGTTFEWNGENRMVRVHKGDLTIENTYDGQGRRVRKLVIDDGTPIEDHRYFYDGWNLIFEYDEINSLENTRYYVWGLDLSQSLQGAGGVGGLLLVRQGQYLWAPTYDANGNISEYIDLSDGSVTAHLEYDAFGRKIVSTGTAPSNFGFSTKYEDPETGYLYYGFRYYDPETGRWPNRDPIEERGGYNLYGFVGNYSVNRIDILGLLTFNLIDFTDLDPFKFATAKYVNFSHAIQWVLSAGETHGYIVQYVKVTATTFNCAGKIRTDFGEARYFEAWKVVDSQIKTASGYDRFYFDLKPSFRKGNGFVEWEAWANFYPGLIPSEMVVGGARGLQNIRIAGEARSANANSNLLNTFRPILTKRDVQYRKVRFYWNSCECNPSGNPFGFVKIDIGHGRDRKVNVVAQGGWLER